MLIALSVQYGLQLHQMDVTTVFLNGTLEEEEVFMKQPEGYEMKGKGAPGVSTQEEHLWSQAIATLLERDLNDIHTL